MVKKMLYGHLCPHEDCGAVLYGEEEMEKHIKDHQEGAAKFLAALMRGDWDSALEEDGEEGWVKEHPLN